MNIEKFENLKMSLMIAGSEVNEKSCKADYEVKVSGDFKIAAGFYSGLSENEQEDLTEGIVTSMYEELTKHIKDEDTVGIWLTVDGEVYENSLKIETLTDMESYSDEDVNSIYEFFKMTLLQHDLLTEDN